MNAARWSRRRAIVLGGLLAGSGDIFFALCWAAYNGVGPQRLLQVVASGALGQAAFSGGMATAALGLLCHFALSFAWMTLFLLAAARLPQLAARPLLAAVGYGLLVFLAMRLVVLPLSAFPRPVTFKPLSTALDLLSHIFLFALPIVWAARNWQGRAQQGALRGPDISAH